MKNAKHGFTGALCALFLMTSIVATDAQASPSAASDELAACLFRHADKNDRDTLVQWAFVTLAKTRAAQRVEKLSDDKIRRVEAAAEKSLTNLVLKHCAESALKVAFTDPKNGLQNTLVSLSKKLAENELSQRTSPLLALKLTDMLRH